MGAADTPMPVAPSPPAEQSDVEVARLVQSWKLATADELQPILDRHQEDPAQLLDVLVDAQLVTPSQAQRVRAELHRTRQPVLRIPGYRVLDRLGSGSMGVVYKARQLSMDRMVALKVLRPELLRDPIYIERFVQEAKLAAKLSHNHIVQAIDVGESDGQYFFVMEFIEGISIAGLLEQKSRLGEQESLRIVLDIARALEHASRRGLVHRDVKPQNIMITSEGVAKLADLGLARATRDKRAQQAESGRAIGTPHYISPEQARGETDIDIRSDIYSLGATLYHMVTGRTPFQGTDPAEILRKHVQEELVPPDHINTALSDGCGLVVEMMMAKRREDRYAGPADLILDLECLLAKKPPKLAQERISARTLANLAEGESADEIPALRRAPPPGRRRTKNGKTNPLLVLLALLLSVSVLFNLLLALGLL
jgi:serine/threonine-protein kinase